jgi:hypothetical protein
MITMQKVSFCMGFARNKLLYPHFLGFFCKLFVSSKGYVRNSYIVYLLTSKKSVSFLCQGHLRRFLIVLLKIMYRRLNHLNWAQIISKDAR